MFTQSIQLSVNGCDTNHSESVIQTLNKYSGMRAENGLDLKLPIDQKIANAILGSKQTRIGGLPSQEQYGHLLHTIRRYLALGKPIETLTMWGATKGYGLFSDRRDVDLLDVLAFRRLACVNEQVKALYPPGLHCTVIVEDMTEIMMATQPGFNFAMETYIKGMRSVVDVLGLSFISIETEIERMHKIGLGLESRIERAGANGKAIRAYWEVLKERNFGDATDTKEYRTLKDLGWVGVLPKEQWEYYLERAKTETPDSSEDVRMDSICTYFGNSLERKNSGILNTRIEDEFGKVQPLKLMFNSLPQGTSDTMRLGRVEYKLKDSKNSNTCVAPWTGFGFIDISFKEPSVCGLRQFRNIERTIVPNKVKITRPVPLADCAAYTVETTEFRCDLLV